MNRVYLIPIFTICGLVFSASAPQEAQNISILFAQLNKPTTTDRAARQILQATSKDPEVRQYVVDRLPGMIDKPETDEVWMNAVRLAGKLKVVEALPALQKAFSLGQLGRPAVTSLGWEMQLDDDVVAKAISRIGDASLPTVTDFLKSSDAKNRRRAVLILLNIDSAASRKLLRDHFLHETDPRIKELIESSLHN